MSYMSSTEVLFLCIEPLLCLDKSLIFTELTEAFYVTLKICALWSLGSVLPVFLYHTWCFIAPGLGFLVYDQEAYAKHISYMLVVA